MYVVSSVYKTKPGDTIYKIIERYNCTFKVIEKLNNFESLKLLKGQKILLPLSKENSIQLYEHYSEKNETLETIIKKYQVSYEEIKYFNNLLKLILESNQDIVVEMKEISPVALEFDDD